MKFLLSPLYPILDAALLSHAQDAREQYLTRAANALAMAGVTVLQYRNKQGSDAEVLRDVQLLRAVAPGSMRILLNDRVHLVARAGCDGVHVGQGDMPVEQVRAIVGPAAMIGLSTHDPAQLEAGDKSSADYLAIGPVYATGSKTDAEAVIGLEGLRRARALTGKPLVAIGGITLARAAEVRAAGVDSLAVISALFGEASGGKRATEPASLRKLAKDFLHIFR